MNEKNRKENLTDEELEGVSGGGFFSDLFNKTKPSAVTIPAESTPDPTGAQDLKAELPANNDPAFLFGANGASPFSDPNTAKPL